MPERRSANLISAAANRCPSSAPPTLRTPSSVNCVVNAGPTVASETPDNSAAHQVTIGYDQVKHHIEDRSQIGFYSPKISYTGANEFYTVTPSVYTPTLTTYPPNFPIDSGLASADNDFHMHLPENINTTNTDISTTVPLDKKISLAFGTGDDADIVMAGMISLTFLLIKLTSILI